MICNNKKITIVKGDSTSFLTEYLLKINITSSVIDISKCTGRFILGDFSFEIEDLSNAIITLTEDQTSQLPIGNMYGSLLLYSNTQQVKTLSTSIPFFVKNWVQGDVLIDEFSLNFNVSDTMGNIININVETSGNYQDLKDEIEELQNTKADKSELSIVATTGSYNDLLNKPAIPTNNDQLINGAGYITQDALTGYALKNELPTKTSDLTNDSGFITNSSLSGLATKAELQEVENSIPDVSGFATKTELNEKADKETVETLLAQTTLSNNTIFRADEMETVELLIPSTIDNTFLCEVDFTSGATATAFTMVDTVKWGGDDITDGSFVPVANKRYNLIIWYDGLFVKAKSDGVEL